MLLLLFTSPLSSHLHWGFSLLNLHKPTLPKLDKPSLLKLYKPSLQNLYKPTLPKLDKPSLLKPNYINLVYSN